MKALILGSLLMFYSFKISNAVLPEAYIEKSTQSYCLAEAVWYEARGEDAKGITAVSSVILNRANANSSSICEVVKASKQFSYRNSYKTWQSVPIKIKNAEQKAKADYIYNQVTLVAKGEFVSNLPEKVLWYHTR